MPPFLRFFQVAIQFATDANGKLSAKRISAMILIISAVQIQEHHGLYAKYTPIVSIVFVLVAALMLYFTKNEVPGNVKSIVEGEANKLKEDMTETISQVYEEIQNVKSISEQHTNTNVLSLGDFDKKLDKLVQVLKDEKKSKAKVNKEQS